MTTASGNRRPARTGRPHPHPATTRHGATGHGARQQDPSQQDGHHPAAARPGGGRGKAALPALPSPDRMTFAGRQEPVAIIGMGCRLPGAPDPSAFWSLLLDGHDAIGQVPPQRWDIQRYYDPGPASRGRTYSNWGGFIGGIDEFDPGFFGISAREASEMDPQQRLALEVAWEAFEDAGYGPGLLGGSATGVFLGVSNADYARLRFRHTATLNAYSGTGSACSIVANRISYLLDLRGPSMAVDTACSASLVAAHLAAQSLRAGETDLAIAGGVNAILSPDVYIAFSQGRFLAPDGRCKTFDAAANGYTRGEGCGIVILKRLADALADGDRVLAVLCGSAVNQDGRSNGLNAPNPEAQRDVIRRALRAAGVAPAEIGYVEAHGTGTELGDPMEVSALAAVLGEGRAAGDRCLLGAVKTNIGHLEAAAGVAGLIKTIQVVRHGVVPPVLHLQRPNSRLDLGETPFEIPTRVRSWPLPGHPRLAGVSSFGFGGTNAHVIVSEPPPRSARSARGERSRQVVCLSARSEDLLGALAKRYAERLRGADDALPDVAFTANTGRAHLPFRLAVWPESVPDLVAALESFATGDRPDSLTTARAPGRPPKVGFLFSGYGSQHPGSGRDLYESQPAFRAAVDRCDDFVADRLGGSPRAFVLGQHPDGGLALELTAQFTLEYGLACLLTECGVLPHAVMGHSLGEYVAACVAGALGHEEALTLVAERGRLGMSLPAGGAMAVVFASEAEVGELLQGADPGRVGIAALNGPVSTAISGYHDAVAEVLDRMRAAGVDGRLLRVSAAGHSPLLEPILDDFERAAGRLTFRAPRLPLVSNVSGRLLADAEVPDAGYWRRHLREPVRFADGMAAMLGLGCEVFVELGPHPSLLTMGKSCAPGPNLTWLPTLKRDVPDWAVILPALGELHVRGVPIDWAAFDAGRPRNRVALPTSSYQRQRYWFEPSTAPADEPEPVRPLAGHPIPSHPLLGRRLPVR